MDVRNRRPSRILRIALHSTWSFLAAATLAVAAPTVLHPVHVIQCATGDDERPAVVTGVAITPDGQTVAAASDDHRVSIWDATSGALKARIGSQGDWVRSASVSSDARLLATGANDHQICLWDLAGQQQLVELPACTSAIAAVAFHPNSQQLAVVGFASTVEIINASSGQVTQHLDCPCSDLRTIAFSKDGEHMAVAGRNGQIRVWNVANGTLQRDIPTDGRRIRALAFSPDGRWLAAAGNSPRVPIFDAASGQQVMTLDVRPAQEFALLFVDQRRLASAGTDNVIRIWDLDSRLVTTELVGHSGTVAALACDAAGHTLVSGSYDTTVRVWCLADQCAPATASRPSTEAAR